MKKWFMLQDCGDFNGNTFSFLGNTSMTSVKYDILELNFSIKCRLYWFHQNRRRNANVEMDMLYADVTYNVSLEEFFSIPYFKKLVENEDDDIVKSKMIQQEIQENDEIKRAVVAKYMTFLCGKVYKEELLICKELERFGSYDDVIRYKEKGFLGTQDDFSEIVDISKCIVDSY